MRFVVFTLLSNGERILKIG